MIRFTVFGKAEPAGSKRAFSRPGMRFPVVVDANPKAKGWKSQVAVEAGKAMAGKRLLTGAVALQIVVFRPRPKGHYGTGKNAGVLKHSSPDYPDTKPDLTKLVRGTEDALRGIVWRDDAQVCRQQTGKLYGEPARAEIAIGAMDESLAFAGIGAKSQAPFSAHQGSC